MDDLDKLIEKLEIELFYLKLIKCITETLSKKTKPANSTHNDFIMNRFMRCE